MSHFRVLDCRVFRHTIQSKSNQVSSIARGYSSHGVPVRQPMMHRCVFEISGKKWIICWNEMGWKRSQ